MLGPVPDAGLMIDQVDTIGRRLDALDARRFVARAAELARLEALLVDEPARNVALVHGPGGIGKSALLREVVRRAHARGWATLVIEGRDLPGGTDSIDAEVRSLGSVAHALVLFDSWEHGAPLTPYLRSHVLPHFPTGWVAIVAGRDTPDAGWSRDGWEQVSLELALTPFGDADAAECLRRHGVDDATAITRLTSWAAGSPLALVLGARVGEVWAPESDVPDEVIGPLVRRFVDADVDERELAILAAAALARVSTPDLLEAAVSGDGDAAYEWLATRSFVEPLGAGVTLHALFASALREYVRRNHAALAAELRRRIADHAYGESVHNGDALSYDLAALSEDPVLQWGFGWDRTGRHRLDGVQPGDIERLQPALTTDCADPWWHLVCRYAAQAPKYVIIVRDPTDARVGIGVAASRRVDPPFPDDPVLVPWLAHARARAGRHDAVIWTVSSVIDGADDAVRALIGFGGILRAGVANPRFAYLPIDPDHDEAKAFSASLGAEPIPELKVTIGSRTMECHVVDFGSGGLLGAQRATVYRELGLVPPTEPVVDGEAVRALLRDYSRADRLAASLLASGDSVAERAQSVRAQICAAIDRAFGHGHHDERLRAVLDAGYLTRSDSHQAVAASLHMSRAVYFRLAREAVDRLAAELRP
jgi:hypothetical protein